MKSYEDTCLDLMKDGALYTEAGMKEARAAFKEEIKDSWYVYHFYATAEWLSETVAEGDIPEDFEGAAKLAQMEIDLLKTAGHNKLAETLQGWLKEAIKTRNKLVVETIEYKGTQIVLKGSGNYYLTSPVTGQTRIFNTLDYAKNYVDRAGYFESLGDALMRD